MHPRRALILTAGLGTRLRPLSDVRAKAALPVGGEPLIRRVIRWLVNQGVTRLVLNLHHRPETITSVVGDGADLGADVRYSWEQPTLLGSAGGPRQALDILGDEAFFIVNGDVLTDLPLSRLVEAHQKTGALATLALVPNREFMKYGGLRLSADGSVVGTVSRGAAAEGSFHFIGPQLVHRDAFKSVKRGEVAQTIHGVYDELSRQASGSIRGMVSEAHYWDIGTVSDYWHTSWALTEAGGTDRTDARIAPTAVVTKSILWDRVRIGDDAIVDECIVTDGVQVPAGATYRRMTLVRTPDGGVSAQPFEVA